MQQDDQLILLIEKAGEIAGSEYKLARTLGLPQRVLTDWKAGRRTCTPGDRARLAGFARQDAHQELVRATINAASGIKKEQLQRLLGKLSHQTGGVALSGLLAITSLTYGLMKLDLPRCIKRQRKKPKHDISYVNKSPPLKRVFLCTKHSRAIPSGRAIAKG